MVTLELHAMPYFYIFIRDGENDTHIAEHGVTTDEFEYVVLNTRRTEASHSSGRPMVIGQTASGRSLCCIYEEIDAISCCPVTAFDVN